MQRIVVTGSQGDLGRLVVDRLVAAGHDVVGVDAVAPPARTDVEWIHVDLATAELAPLLEGVDTLVHLAFRSGSAPDEAQGRRNADAAARLLDAATEAGVGALVATSSSVVYGARPDNPVPLTEDALLRPNTELAFAAEKAEVERLVGDWRHANPDAAVCVLRPAVTVGEGTSSWLATVMRTAAALRSPEGLPPRQFLHLEDLADAVVLAVDKRLDDVFNVAPEGWIPGDEVKALAGATPHLPVDGSRASRVAAWARRLGMRDLPEGIEPYLLHPWVVASDRLVLEGWKARHSNEQAFVAAHDPSAWTEMSPKNRQNLALAATGVALAGVAAGAAAALRRARR